MFMKDIDFGTRDKRGDWKPNGRVQTNPKHIIPFEPVKLLKHIFGWNGYIFPWTFIWASIAVICWFFFTPPLEQMKHLELGWISFILFRNALIIFLWSGAFHLKLKYQGSAFKYNPKPLETNASKFFFNNQTLDKMKNYENNY